MYRVNIVDIFRRAVTGMSHIAVPWRFLKRFAALPAILTNTVED